MFIDRGRDWDVRKIPCWQPGRDWRKKRPSWLNKERRAKKRRSENHFVSGGRGESILQDHLFRFVVSFLELSIKPTHGWGLKSCGYLQGLLHGICMWMRPVRRARALRWKKMRSCHRWPADAMMPMMFPEGSRFRYIPSHVIKRESYWNLIGQKLGWSNINNMCFSWVTVCHLQYRLKMVQPLWNR